MANAEENDHFSCISAIYSCLALSITYVASFYVWNSPLNREDPTTIKKRFFSIFIMSLISPATLYFGMDRKVFQKITVWEVLGLRWSGLIQAIILPLSLTMILFLGPITLQARNDFRKLYTEPMHWLSHTRTIHWWRNQVVAPLSEEWTFRACMLPLLLQCFRPTIAIFVGPLFFGVAHFHHIVERTRNGMTIKHALLISCFQFVYTTLFGAYAAFLFVRTGHFAAPVAAHSFCNHMGFPDLSEIATYENRHKRIGMFLLFVFGLVTWCCLLVPMTQPFLFSNNLLRVLSWDKNAALH